MTADTSLAPASPPSPASQPRSAAAAASATAAQPSGPRHGLRHASMGATAHRLDGRRVALERVLHAPRELAFLAWTDPVHLARWWGPQGFRSVVRELDLRVGGRFRICMVAPDGEEFPVRGEYEQISPPQRLVYVEDWDDDGRPSLASRVTVDFAEDGPERTRLRVQVEFADTDQRDEALAQGILPGWAQSFERLDAYLAER